MPTPAYILELRRAYGHGRLLLPGVCAVVVRDQDGTRQLLLGRRTDSGRWALPSGIIEPDEQPAGALVREVAEETGVEIEVERLALLVTDPEIGYPNGDRSQYVSMTFRCRYRSGEARVADDESTDVGWFALDELPESVTDRDRRRIEVALTDQEACVFEL